MKTAELNQLVQQRFAPPDYGLLANVADPGASRWCDWLAMGLWQSRGLKLIGQGRRDLSVLR